MRADARDTRGQQERDDSAAYLLGLDFTFYLGFSLGLRPVYCIVPKDLF